MAKTVVSWEFSCSFPGILTRLNECVTYSLLSLSLVGFHLHLQLVHQILQPQNILAVFLRLKPLANRKESEFLVCHHLRSTAPLGAGECKICLAVRKLGQPKEASCLTW